MTKTNKNIAVCIITSLLVIGFSDSASAQSQVTMEPPGKWNESIDNYTGQKALLSYRAIRSKPVSHEQAFEMIKQFQETTKTELSFEQVHKSDNRMIFTSKEDTSAVFDVDSTTGAFLFNSGLKKYSKEGTTAGLPSSKEAPELALKYLDQLNYMPVNRKEMVLTHVGGLGMAAAKEGKSTEKFEKLSTVFFRRELNSLPVQGPGSRIVLHLGEKGELIGLIRNWYEVKAQRIAKDQLKKDEMIRREIERRVMKMAGEADEIIVEKTEIVLFDDGRGVIEPAVYVVATAMYQGSKRTEKRVEIPVDFYVPFLLKPSGYYPFHQDLESKWPGTDREE